MGEGVVINEFRTTELTFIKVGKQWFAILSTKGLQDEFFPPVVLTQTPAAQFAQRDVASMDNLVATISMDGHVSQAGRG